ncbi:alpha/beta fold hydrolase [Nocardia paucivorans]|uniref:alpha/beta fold hydrolase n=1 Tax=Nocardia paucivorans TaxID=114259 RepID=UPI0003059C76|nr:alpha/beta hydrolase [Nocardia paucivorans]
MRSATLTVPGATLYYEIRGTGPLLLSIPGGGGDAGVFDEMADVLERHFTVVALDPRGHSRSTLDDSTADRRIATQSEDAYRLLTHLSERPAFVFGTSAGAVVCLELLARHPDRVRRMVVHEPPCLAALPDAAEHLAMIEEVHELFRTAGIGPAMARFLTGMGEKTTPPPNTPDLPPRIVELRARLAANTPAMLEHELREITSYQPDYAALATVADRLIPAVGRVGDDTLPHRSTVEIATRLGRTVTEFPGGHNGIRTDAAEFAHRLVEVLAPEVESDSV